MSAEWTDNTVLHFINEYKEQPILWDTYHEHHKSTNKKHEAWSKISHTMNLPIDELKFKIASLMASYRRERRKLIKKEFEMGIEGVQSKWFAFEAFSFLNEVYTPKNSYEQEDNMLEVDVKWDLQGAPPLISNSSTSTPEPIPKKKKILKDRSSNEVPTGTCMNCFSRDEADEEIIVKCWALKLKRMTWEQRVYAEKFINEILLEGELGNLDRHSFKINESPDCSLHGSQPHLNL